MKLTRLVSIVARTLFGASLVCVVSSAAFGHDLKICKESDAAGPVTGTFTFDVSGHNSIEVAVGACVTLFGVGPEPITVTEQAVSGVAVTAITVSGAASSTTDTVNRTATVTVPEGGLVTVTFPVALQRPAGSSRGAGGRSTDIRPWHGTLQRSLCSKSAGRAFRTRAPKSAVLRSPPTTTLSLDNHSRRRPHFLLLTSCTQEIARAFRSMISTSPVNYDANPSGPKQAVELHDEGVVEFVIHNREARNSAFPRPGDLHGWTLDFCAVRTETAIRLNQSGEGESHPA